MTTAKQKLIQWFRRHGWKVTCGPRKSSSVFLAFPAKCLDRENSEYASCEERLAFRVTGENAGSIETLELGKDAKMGFDAIANLLELEEQLAREYREMLKKAG